MINRGLLLIAASVVACHPRPPDVPPEVLTACEAACARGAELGCVFALPTPGGVRCVQVCRDTEATGWTTMPPACIAHASSCKAADHVSAYGCAGGGS
jgi:hypothetical protein